MTTFKEVAHLYLGCECRIYEEDMIDFDVDKTQGAYDNKIVFKGYGVNIRFVKPILRPLDSMTEEEMKELVLINRTAGENIKNIHLHNGAVWFDKQVKAMKHWVSDAIQLDQAKANEFLWLLSKHFDLFQLLENGQALTTTQK